MSENTQQDTNNLLEYRISKLEEGIVSMNTLRDVVLKWDAKFTEHDVFMQCPIHTLKIANIEKQISKLEEIVGELDRFKWKAVGVLSAVMLVIQIFGSSVAAKYFHPTNLATKSAQSIDIQKLTKNNPIIDQNGLGNWNVSLNK